MSLLELEKRMPRPAPLLRELLISRSFLPTLMRAGRAVWTSAAFYIHVHHLGKKTEGLCYL